MISIGLSESLRIKNFLAVFRAGNRKGQALLTSESIINVITNAALIPTLLQNGVVVASVISEFVTNAIQFVYMKKKVKFNLNWKSLITGIFSTAGMSICVLGLKLLELPNTIGLIGEVGCGALVYIAINLIMKNALIFEMIQKFKTKLLHKA